MYIGYRQAVADERTTFLCMICCRVASLFSADESPYLYWPRLRSCPARFPERNLLRFFHSLRRFPTPRASGYFPQRRSRRSARTSVCTVSHSPSSKTDGSRDGRSHPRRERGARGAHAPFGEIGESARSRRHAGVRRASPRRRRRRRERALPQSLAQAGYRPRGRRGACALPTANRRKRPASFGLSSVPLCSYRV